MHTSNRANRVMSLNAKHSDVIWKNIFNFKNVVFPALSIQTMQRTHAVVTDQKSVFHFLCFSHFSEGMRLQDKGHMVLLLLTNRRVRDRICPVALPSPNQLKIHSAKQTQNTAISGWKHNIGRCQQENLTLCQVSDTNLPEILKFNKANLPCSLDFGLRSYGFRSRFWQQTSLPNPTPTKLQRSYL